MKYLPLLLLLAGCESFPEKKEEAHLMEQIPLGETWVDDMIDDSIKAGPIDAQVQLGAFGFYLEPPILEIDLVSITGRRFMLYIDVVGV